MVLQNADVDVTDDLLFETRSEIRSARRQDNLRLGGFPRSILELRVNRMILYKIWRTGVSAVVTIMTVVSQREIRPTLS